MTKVRKLTTKVLGDGQEGAVVWILMKFSILFSLVRDDEWLRMKDGKG
jgi:hypothetical protein